MTREQFAEKIRIGHNLGNALECIEPVCGANVEFKIDREVTDKNGYHDHRITIRYPDGTYSYFYSFEEIWSNVPVTDGWFKVLKDVGVQSVRIPVNLSGHIIDETNHTIDPLWLKRIREVVDMAINNGLIVDLCLHTDFVLFYRMEHFMSLRVPEDGIENDAVGVLISVWTPLAEYMKDISVEKLCFELMNEFRIHDVDYDLSTTIGHSIDLDEKATYTARLNKYLFDAIRATGGNNTRRFLLIGGYGNSPDVGRQVFIDTFKEWFDNRCLITACYYCPWEFCVSNRHISWQMNGEVKQMMEYYYDILTSVANELNVPLVITEYGVGCNENEMLQKDTFSICRYIYTVMKMMKSNNVSAYIWDPGYIIRRDTNTFGIPFWKEMVRYVYFGEPFDLYDTFTECSDDISFERINPGISRTIDEIRALDEI